MKLIESIESWCDKYALPTSSNCYKCESEVKAVDFFATRNYRGVEYTECCGSSSVTAVKVRGENVAQKIIDIFKGED